jgi:hypothetical protein
MDITEKDIKAALSKSKDDITKAVVESLKERMIHDIKYASNDAVEKTIKEFIDAEIVPEIKSTLRLNKAAMLEELNKAAITIGTEVAKIITTKAIANLTGYRGTEIIKKLME